MPFKKGKTKTGGREPGVENKITRTVKETVLNVFNDLQEDPDVKLSVWAKKEPTEFYKIASKLIPTEITAVVKNVYVVDIEDD